MKDSVLKIMTFTITCFLVVSLTACAKDKNDMLAQSENFEIAEEARIEYIKEHADDLFKDKIEKYINIANYYSYGHYDIPAITDEQKIVLGLTESCTDTLTISKEKIENILAEYFVILPKEHISIESPYIEAIYDNDAYKIVRDPSVGAVCYEVEIKDIKGKTDDNNLIVCTADLLFIHAAGIDCVGESTVTLSLEGGNYKILDYSQKIYEAPIVIENNDV